VAASLASGDSRVALPYLGPLDLPLLLRYFERRAIGGVEHVDLGAGTYRRTVVVDGSPRILELSVGSGGAGHDGDPRLRLTDPAGRPLPAPDLEVVERARHIFSLDADPTAALAHLRGDGELWAAMNTDPGLRVPGTWDPFETGVRAIVGQQVSVAGASTITGRIARRAGLPLPAGVTGLTHLFPTAEALAAADLAGVGMPTARIAAVTAWATAVAGGAVRLDGVVHRPADGGARRLPGRRPGPAPGPRPGRSAQPRRPQRPGRALAPLAGPRRPAPLARRLRSLVP